MRPRERDGGDAQAQAPHHRSSSSRSSSDEGALAPPPPPSGLASGQLTPLTEPRFSLRHHIFMRRSLHFSSLEGALMAARAHARRARRAWRRRRRTAPVASARGLAGPITTKMQATVSARAREHKRSQTSSTTLERNLSARRCASRNCAQKGTAVHTLHTKKPWLRSANLMRTSHIVGVEVGRGVDGALLGTRSATIACCVRAVLARAAAHLLHADHRSQLMHTRLELRGLGQLALDRQQLVPERHLLAQQGKGRALLQLDSGDHLHDGRQVRARHGEGARQSRCAQGEGSHLEQAVRQLQMPSP